MKYKTLIVLFIITILVLGSGLTYSFFHSSSHLQANDQGLAKFIFEAQALEQLDLSLVGLEPGQEEEYLFTVTNNKAGQISDVLINYQLTIKTYHFVPFIIELYKLDNEEAELVLVCDESYTRNDQNELICNTQQQEMAHSLEKQDNYKLVVKFPAEYNDEIYANLVDYINIDVKSWQKIEEVG